MQIPNYFEFSASTKIISGKNSLSEINKVLKSFNVSSPMLLTDSGVDKVGLFDTVLNKIDKDIKIKVVEKNIPPDSDIKIAGEISKKYLEKKCDSIIAIGGGSVIDTAKGVNIAASNSSFNIGKFYGAGKLTKKLNPLIVIPTTAGTGSEITQAAVIVDNENKRKLLFTSHLIVPDVAILDPVMTKTMPDFVTAATAMDALTHSIEAYISLAKNPLSDASAFYSINLIVSNLLKTIDDPSNETYRHNLAVAATLAGMSFSNSMCGIIHAMGHSVGSICKVPHGVCMAIGLPFGLEYNLKKREKLIGELLLPLGGIKVYNETPPKKRAKKSIALIRDLNEKLHTKTANRHPTCFKQVKNVKEEDLPKIAETALGDGTIIYNPEEISYDDFMSVLRAAFEGKSLLI